TNVTTMRNISPSQLVAEMKLGTNFAHALDAVGWDQKLGYDEYKEERYVGYNKIQYYLSQYLYIPTAQTVSDPSKAGDNAVRLNVSFSLFTNDKTFQIDKDFLDVVEKTVNMFLDKGMYCIIDPHCDYLSYSWVGDKWERNWMADQYKDYVNTRYSS